jgi:hypothetical protein
MPVSPEILREVRDLLSLLRDDLITDEQGARLTELLCGEIELRRLYIQYTAMEEHLRQNLSDYTFVRDPQQSECAAMLMDALDSLQQARQETEHPDTLVFGQVVADADGEPDQMVRGPFTPLPSQHVQPVVRGTNHYLAWLISAAAVLIVAVSILTAPQSWKGKPVQSPAPVPAPLPVLATITAENQAVWEIRPSEQQELAGQKSLNLLQGSVELTFAGGAHVILEAPAQLRLDSASSLSLHSGKLTATAHGGGFVVRTPNAVVTDLGTEFGVAAENNGAIVSVFQGSVALAPKSDSGEMPATLVQAGSNVQADNTGQVKPAAPATALSFLRNDEFQARLGAARGSDYDRWEAYTYQVRRDPDLLLFYSFDVADQGGDRLTNLAATGQAYDAKLVTPSNVAMLWSHGRIPGKGALSLQADGDCARVNIPDSLTNMTIVAWVRLDELPAYYAGILSSEGSVSKRCYFGIKYMTNLNFHGYRGGKGVIQPLERQSQIKRWLQVAAVYDSKAKLASIYNDGELLGAEALTATDVIQPGSVSIGCWFPRSGVVYRFNGSIDELQVYRRALTAAEISSLFRDGKP